MSSPRIAVLLLAAGRASRMGGPNKLLATFGSVPLVRRSAETALASRAERVVAVVGHQATAVRQALDGLPVEILTNPDFAAGLSTSLRLGFAAAAQGADGVLVMLADQPELCPAHLDALISAFADEGLGSIVVAAHEGVRGNPAILSARFAAAIGAIDGDRGARGIIAANAALVREVEIGAAALVDVDTPEALAAAGGTLPPDAVPRRS